MHEEARASSHSIARRVYAAFGLFLVLTPLALQKPGVPGGLKADESAYVMMASSLAWDLDLVVGADDTRRLFDEFPLRWTSNLIVFSDDGWSTVHYGKPYVYPLFVAPFARLFGSNGLLCANLLMLWLMVGIGWRVIAEHDPGPLALFFSAGFFGLSACSVYAFWLQPEVFNMFFVTLALYLGFPWRKDRAPGALALFASGCALALPVYNKPMLVALALPVVLPPLLRRGHEASGGGNGGDRVGERAPSLIERLRPAALTAGGGAITIALLVAGSLLLTGHASAYGVAGRQGVRVCEPGEVPRPAGWTETVATAAVSSTPAAIAEASAAEAEADADAAADPENRSFYWLLRVPELEPGRWLENLGYFLWGRHTGLVHYFPWAVLAVLLFLRRGRGADAARWWLLGSVAMIAIYFLLYIGWNWQGGGGFVGNRYFVNAVPALIFLVRDLRPTWTLLATSAWTGLVIGPLLLTPFGITVPEATLQAHTRNWPLRHFPLELTLKNVPGYHSENLGEPGELRWIARADQVVRRGHELVAAARVPVRVLLLAREPLDRYSVQLVGQAPDSTVEISLGGDRETLQLTEGEARTVELEPRRAARRHLVVGPAAYVYELEVRSDRGGMVHWTRYFPPWPCDSFRFDRQVSESFYGGVALRLLGPSDEVASDIYQLSWDQVTAPATVGRGERFVVTAEITNRSRAAWTARGVAEINLSSHWLETDGTAVDFDGLRAPAPPLAPGESGRVELPVRAPSRPGVYLLELDLVREYVSWFAERNGGQTHRSEVTVTVAARQTDVAEPGQEPTAPGAGD